MFQPKNSDDSGVVYVVFVCKSTPYNQFVPSKPILFFVVNAKYHTPPILFWCDVCQGQYILGVTD